jgi:hypothetical protein
MASLTDVFRVHSYEVALATLHYSVIMAGAQNGSTGMGEDHVLCHMSACLPQTGEGGARAWGGHGAQKCVVCAGIVCERTFDEAASVGT